MKIREIIDRRLPKLAATYRLLRDRWLASRLIKHALPDGTEMIAGYHMAASRLDSGELLLFQSLLSDADFFLDVGANCGLFTIMARKAGVKTACIEPNSGNLRILLANLSNNALDEVEVFALAVSRGAGVMPLFGGGEGASLCKNWGGMASTYSNLVPVNSLDNLFADRCSAGRLLIKVDVEGHEYDALQGAIRLLERQAPTTWLVEHGFTENFSGGVNPHFLDLFEIFWSRGYECFTADDEKHPVQKEDVLNWLAAGRREFGPLNYLFYKESAHV